MQSCRTITSRKIKPQDRRELCEPSITVTLGSNGGKRRGRSMKPAMSIMFLNLPRSFFSASSLLNLSRFFTSLPSSSSKLFPHKQKQQFLNNHSIFFYSLINSKTKPITFFHLLTFIKNTKHLKSEEALLIVHGLTENKLLLGQFLRSCFHLGALDIALSAFTSVKKPCLFLQNLMIRGLSNHGLYEDVLSVYRYCRVLSCPSDDFTFPFVIKACSVLGAFGIGKEIHCVVLRTGHEGNVVIQTALIDFYGKIGYIGTARRLIDRIPKPDLVSWNALIACYSVHGLDQEAFKVFKHIFVVGLKPNLSTLATVIPLCNRLGCLRIGKSLHGFAVKCGYFVNDLLAPALISMYACDVHLSTARKLFDCVLEKNVDVWNAMISAYMQNHMPFEAFEIFQEMLCADVQPNLITFVSIIPSCEIGSSICYGESFHAYVIKHGSEDQVSVLTALMSMYAKLGEINKAKFLFDWMPNKNILSWNVMVSGYVHNGMWDESLAAFCEMQFAEFSADAVSIISVLSACSKLVAVLLGKSAHAFSIRKGLDSNLNVSNALLSFYSDCNRLTSSFKLFHKLDNRNVVSWNTLLSGSIQHGEMEKAVILLHQMQKEGMGLDLVTLISILPMYCDQKYLGQGMTLHCCAIKNGFISDISLVNALISMYCKCGDLEAGRLLFEVMPKRSVVSWNALITVHRHHNLQHEVLVIFSHMIKEDQRPNSVTLLNLLPVCCCKLQGKSIHAFAIRTGVLQETPLRTSLILMYARFEITNWCFLLFEMGQKEDISLWNAIISVHILMKNANRAVSSFCDLLQMGLQPDNITVLSLISACAQLNSMDLAHSLMAYLVHNGFDKDVTISNTLVDLYARCGDIVTARKLFDSLLEKDAVSWNVMIHGYSLHGDGETALEIFSQMQLLGVRPNDNTFSSILSACSHGGLVEQGWMVFKSMIEHGISPRMGHYACMVDLLGRRGHLNEAYDIVKSLPCKPSISLLESLLGACRIHGNVELGERICKMLFELDPKNSGSYVMLSDIYAAAERWIDADKVRSNIEGKRLRKLPGYSLLLGDGNYDQ